MAGSINQADATRFLEQAAWGSDSASLQNCEKLSSISQCLAKQFNYSPSLYPVTAAFPANSSVGCPAGSAKTCFRDNYTQYQNQVEFFNHALTGQDQLRQRVAFALHQILVVSGVKISQPSYFAPYLNVLQENAFGNFRQLLEDITLNPAMGHYLDMVNNNKPSANGKLSSNENYAREVLQLFTIGLYWLNADGSQMLDSQKLPIPTYSQDTIENFALVFTGWTYADPGSASAGKFPNAVNYADPMVLYRNKNGLDQNHDKSAKILLSLSPNGHPVNLPANQDGKTDLKEALDNIFNHPNVGPFIGKQLIQHLVTSNPSSAYVKRVTEAFNSGSSHGFGSGKRGDLQAVIAAILLDQEARGATPAGPEFGRLREPVQLVVNVLKALNAESDGILNEETLPMGQNLFNSPTVFNYYPHEYTVPGLILQGPEFGIASSSQLLTRENFVNTVLFGKIQPDSTSSGTTVDFSQYTNLANTPDVLVNQLNQDFLHGGMPQLMQTQLLAAIESVPANDPKLRAQTALYLVLASGQYQVQR
jgi:uncharacterized protein (DUF1800 family)